MTPGTLVASNLDDLNAGDDDSAKPGAAPVKKPTVQQDDQLSKALELLKAKAA